MAQSKIRHSSGFNRPRSCLIKWFKVLAPGSVDKNIDTVVGTVLGFCSLHMGLRSLFCLSGPLLRACHSWLECLSHNLFSFLALSLFAMLSTHSSCMNGIEPTLISTLGRTREAAEGARQGPRCSGVSYLGHLPGPPHSWPCCLLLSRMA